MRARRCDGRTGREEVPGALCCISTLRKPVTGHARREPLHVAYSDDRVLRAQSWPFHAALRGTRHPWTHTCSTTSWLSPRTTIDRAPCRTASSSPIMSPVYSASLFVAPPRYRPPFHTHTLSWYNIAPEFEPVSCCRTVKSPSIIGHGNSTPLQQPNDSLCCTQFTREEIHRRRQRPPSSRFPANRRRTRVRSPQSPRRRFQQATRAYARHGDFRSPASQMSKSMAWPNSWPASAGRAS
jgi:hypothetical protein